MTPRKPNLQAEAERTAREFLRRLHPSVPPRTVDVQMLSSMILHFVDNVLLERANRKQKEKRNAQQR